MLKWISTLNLICKISVRQPYKILSTRSALSPSTLLLSFGWRANRHRSPLSLRRSNFIGFSRSACLVPPPYPLWRSGAARFWNRSRSLSTPGPSYTCIQFNTAGVPHSHREPKQHERLRLAAFCWDFDLVECESFDQAGACENAWAMCESKMRVRMHERCGRVWWGWRVANGMESTVLGVLGGHGSSS